VNTYALPCTVLVIMAILMSALDIKRANYIVLGELPSGGTWSTISSVTNDLVGASNMSTYSNSSQTAKNTTMNIPSNDTILNSNITKESSSLNSNITKELSSLNFNITKTLSSLNSNITKGLSSLNPNITNKSSSLNTTMRNQLPPESINGSKVGKI
jgi:hypothetical protein